MLGGYPPIHLCYLTDFPLEKMVLVVFEAATSSRAPAMAPVSRTMHAVSTGRSIAGLKKLEKLEKSGFSWILAQIRLLGRSGGSA